MRVSIYIRQLYPNCPEFLPKPMAQMLKIMLDREFLPCDFQDTPDFWQELASVFPGAEEPAIRQRSSHAGSFTHLGPAGAVFMGPPPPEAHPPTLQQQQQQQQPAQPTFPAHFVQPSYRPQSMAPVQAQAQAQAPAQPSLQEPPRPQYQQYQALSQPPFQAPVQAPAQAAPLQTPTPAYQPMNPLRAPAAPQPLQPAAPPPHPAAAAPAQVPAQAPGSMQAPTPSAAQAPPRAPTPTPAPGELTCLPLHMQASVPLHMQAAVLARMQAALAASKPPTHAPAPPSTAPAQAPGPLLTAGPAPTPGPTPTAPGQAPPAPPRVAAYIPPHMQAAHQASALPGPAPAYPPGFTPASSHHADLAPGQASPSAQPQQQVHSTSPPAPPALAQPLDPRRSPAVTVQRVVTPEDWSYSVDPAFLASEAEAEESSAGFTVVRGGGGQAAVKPAGALTYKEKPARPHGSKFGYTVQDLLPVVQAYIQQRLQPGHLLAEHFDSEVVRKLKGFSQAAAMEVLWFVPTREKSVDNPVRNMRGFLMNNIVNMIKRIEHLQAQGR
ncbi:MAG: hypothetical protein WDW36_005700 [Sanguina aurantia]